MAKFIIFNKLVDLRKLTINMDTVKTMEPVSKLYDGHMRDCTDIYYENHRVTVLSGLEDIMSAISNMSDGDIVDISETIVDNWNADEHGINPEDPEIPVTYATRTITGFIRNTPGNNSQHQTLLTDIEMSDPWPTSSSDVSPVSLNMPEDQDYVYVLYYDIYEGNHQYAGWTIPIVCADEQSATDYLNTHRSDSAGLEWHGPIQIPLNTIFDVVNDGIEQNESITKIYVTHKKTNMGSNQNNEVYFGPASTPEEALDINRMAVGSPVIELPLPSGEEIEADADGRYQFYLAYYVLYKSRGGARPYRRRIIFDAKSSRAFTTKNDAIIYISNKNEGVDIDTMGYEYKWAYIHTGQQYSIINNGSLYEHYGAN